MTEENMKEYVKTINSFKPKVIEAYVSSIYELAKFIKENDLDVYSPKGGILTSAGTLYPDMEELIKEVFNCKIINRYGSREVGDIACSRDGNENLEINILQNYAEILDHNLNPVKPGENGKIYITTLNNFSMPLIRYEIGDIGIRSENEFEIKRIEGRVGTLIKTKKGTFDSTALTTSFYGLYSIKKYQFIQETRKIINIKVVINDKYDWNKESKILKDKLLIILGDDVEINFIIQEDILSLDNGKYLYFISKVK
ncbi:hypothetical protein [Candidatus Vampirococcus lugosii]|uniref:CapK related-protein n=1 Tax=Candidatus Vampirococcus lugosii TaxID=2789015 RepID=A0ABS5QK90_9BACT|nr:hypothetical protein [Candidatus Vampirococcus lugosii]MBS8121661.1 CapK related-protein [Candidatus Vampirococcus lugosii]